MKNYLLLGFAVLVFTQCTKDDSNPDGNKNLPIELTQADFNKALTLENRNDGVDYIIKESINMSHALEVRPGVVIEFGEDAGIDIGDAGSMSAVGLSDQKIVFTGMLKTKGAWKGILVESTSLKNQFKYCEISYGGGSSWGNDIQGGLTTWSDGRLNVDHCTFRENKSYGFQAYNSQQVELRSFENNSFENNELLMIVHPTIVHQIGRDNVFVGSSPVIDIYGGYPFDTESGTSKTWKAHSVAYRVLEAVFIFDNNITIEAGAKILFTEQGYIEVNDGGSLTAIGTPTNPIILDGEINVSGSWPGLSYQFTNSIKNELSYVTIRNAGGGQQSFGKGVFYLWAQPTVSVKNCTFQNCKECIFNPASSGDLPNVTEENNNYGGAELMCN